MSVIPPEEFRRRAQELLAEQSGAAATAAVVPPDLQLPSPPLEGGASPMNTFPPGAPPLPRPGPPESITSNETGERLDQLRVAIRALQLYAEGEHDDQELATVHKCVVAIQSILADNAKNRDAALGVTPALKHVRRASSGY